MKYFYLILLLLSLSFHLEIKGQFIFNNPSFEGTAGNNLAPAPWQICSGTPDTGPTHVVGLVPSQGQNCLGLVNSLPGIQESVSEILPITLDTLSCYGFDIDLRYIPNYLGNCNPGVLRLWLGNSICDRDYLAWTSPRIANGPYRTYNANFQSPQNYTHVTWDLTHTSPSPQNVCMGIDNIHNETISRLNVDLGNDTTLCPGDTLLIDASYPNSTYVWQDNSTDSVFVARSEGLIWVIVTDQLGCSGVDSIHISFEEELFLGNDTNLCGDDSLILQANLSPSPSINYLWQDNSTNPSLLAKDSGWYSLTTTSAFCVQNDSLLLSKPSDPMLDLGLDTGICSGQSLNLDATVSGTASYLWSTNATTPQITVNSSGNYKVTVTIANCDYVDSINVTIGSIPTFSLGPDTVLCPNEVLVLDGPRQSGYQYLWSDNSTAPSLAVQSPGQYWLEVSLGNCTERDTIMVSQSTFGGIDPISLKDTTLCFGEDILLNANTAGASTYRWQDNSTNPSLLVNQPGEYRLTVSDGICDIFDTVQVNYSTLQPFSLGEDTTICPNEQLVLNAPNKSSFTYSWQDASTSSSFTVGSAGLYWVEVIDGLCSERDSIQVSYENFDPTELNLGNDTTICNGDSIILDGTVSWGVSYLWQDNVTTAQRTVKTPGIYQLTVTNGNCQYTDNINVGVDIFSPPDLGPDTTLCLNDSLILDYGSFGGISYLWQDGSNGSQFIVRQDGTYWLQISTGSCIYRDSVVVNYLNTVAPQPDLGKDTNLCEGDQLLLDASHSNVSTYLWHDGSTSSTFIASGLKDSTYFVTVTNDICVGSDTIVVGGISRPSLQFDTTTICASDNIALRVDPPEGMHLWQDGSQGASYLATDSGKYLVTTTKEHCVFRDSAYVKTIDCECIPKVPSVFTPNGDGINDRLMIQLPCNYQSFEFKVFNRYGQLVFASNNPNITWNGKLRERKLNQGTYFFVLNYRDNFSNQLRNERGSITLLR